MRATVLHTPVRLWALGLLTGATLTLPASAPGVIRHVPDPYPTVQSAITAALPGDTVLADPGTYAEAIDFLGKEILVGSRFVLTGDTSYVSATILDAHAIPYAHVVSIHSGEGPGARLSGFTVTGGSANEGGGIHCSQTSPTLDHLRITDNWAGYEGGGIYAYGQGPTVRDCWIVENGVLDEWSDGGGIWAQYSTIRIEECEIHGNQSGYRGAGIFCEHSYQTITRCRITGNVVGGPDAYYGGGIASRNCAPEITDNYLANNDGGDYGGGLFY